MSKEKKVSKCFYCGGKLHKLGTIGVIRYSRCEACGQEQTKKLKKASLDKTVFSNNLSECITCKSKYAAVTDPDLCPDCHSSFTGKVAATVTLSAPVNCEFCFEQNEQVQAAYDVKTKLGSWAFVCEKHLGEYGVGLGKNSGRQLVIESEKKKPIRNMDIGETEEFESPLIEPIEVPAKEKPKEEPLFIPEEWPTEAPQEPAPLPPTEPEEPVTPTEPEPVTPTEPEEEPKKTPEIIPVEPEKVPVGVGRTKKLVNASDNAYPNKELTQLIQQQRQDTSRWQDGENHSPNPNVDPGTLHGDSSLPPIDRMSETSVNSGTDREGVVARVFSDSEDIVEGAKVLLQDGPYQVIGKVITEAEDGFLVEWRTGRRSIEKKASFELMVVTASGSADTWGDYWLGEIFKGDPVNGYKCDECGFTIPGGSTPDFIDIAATAHATDDHGYDNPDSDYYEDYDEDDYDEDDD